MKRLWLAASLFGIVLLLCVTALQYQRRQVTALITSLGFVEEAVAALDIDTAYSCAQALQNEFEQRTALFPCFMKHDAIADCRESIRLLPSILKDGNAEEFHMESARCRAHLTHLIEEEQPSWQNIL